MIYDAIERIGDELEDIAVLLHKPQKAIYAVVREDGTYREMNEEKFAYNSKFCCWDFWSQLITMNQPVDKKKIIQSNNKYSFFVKDFKKLSEEIIEEYYKKTELEDSESWIKEWIYKNIEKFRNRKNELIKFFFYADTEKYKECGKRYFKEKCIRNKQEYNQTTLGSGIGVVENSKKPYMKNHTRKTEYLERIEEEMAYKKTIFFLIIKSCIRRKQNYIYITNDGKIYPRSVREPVEIDTAGGILFVTKMDEKGNVVFDLAEPLM